MSENEKKIVRPTDIKYWYPFLVTKESPFKDVKMGQVPQKFPSLERERKST